MGDFIIKIHAVGGHGCQRQAKPGEVFYGCGRMDCPDCIAQEFVQKLRKVNQMHVESATFTHWPFELDGKMGRSYTEKDEVVDDLFYQTKDGFSNITMRKRIKGEFKG